MRNAVRLVALVFGLVVLSAQVASADETNLLTNAGFETGDYYGWTHSPGYTGIESEDVHSGSYGAECYQDTSWLKQDLTTGVSWETPVSVSCWFEQDHSGHGAEGPSVWFFVGRENGQDVTPNWAVSLADPPTWQQVSFSFVVTGLSDTVGLRAGVSTFGTYNGFFMDDCSLTVGVPLYTPMPTRTVFPSVTPLPSYTPIQKLTPLPGIGTWYPFYTRVAEASRTPAVIVADSPVDISGIRLTIEEIGSDVGLFLVLPYLLGTLAVVLAVAIVVEIFGGVRRIYRELFGREVPLGESEDERGESR